MFVFYRALRQFVPGKLFHKALARFVVSARMYPWACQATSGNSANTFRARAGGCAAPEYLELGPCRASGR